MRDLRCGVCAVTLGEQDVVIGVRVEGGIEVHEIDALVRDVLFEHVEVVPIEEAVRERGQ
jgi:exosome complex RNA-binding protein Rrp42 (RNase PH superfamily)